MPIRRTFLLLVFFIINFLFSTAHAIHFPKPPNNKFYVDQANLIQPSIRNEINQIASRLWQERKIPLFVVTIPSLITEGAIHYTLRDYATALFNFWGIGSKQKSYGMLLLISKAERMASIILGTGWGNAFDMKKNHITREMLVTDFDRENFSDAILKGVNNINDMTIGINIPKQSQLINKNNSNVTQQAFFSYPLFKLIIASSIIFIMLILLNSNQRKQISAIKKEQNKKSDV